MRRTVLALAWATRARDGDSGHPRDDEDGRTRMLPFDREERVEPKG